MGTLSSDQVSTGPRPASPDLSIVIPCYKCADTIGTSIDKLTDYLEETALGWELILVDDGSRDGTADALAAYAPDPRIEVVRLPRNYGKGRAVSEGMLRARGACRIFTDADLPYALEAIATCADMMRRGSAAVFGNRLLRESDARAQPWLRKRLGALVRLLAGMLLGRFDVDTQCGFKGFSGPVADIVFQDLRTNGFLFDVEVARVLIRAGVTLDFVPVVLLNHDKSSVRLVPTGVRTLLEAWRVVRTRKRDVEKIAALRAHSRRSNT